MLIRSFFYFGIGGVIGGVITVILLIGLAGSDLMNGGGFVFLLPAFWLGSAVGGIFGYVFKNTAGDSSGPTYEKEDNEVNMPPEDRELQIKKIIDEIDLLNNSRNQFSKPKEHRRKKIYKVLQDFVLVKYLF